MKYVILPHERNRFADPRFVDGMLVEPSPPFKPGEEHGYHPDAEYITVRPAGSTQDCWYGIKRENLLLIVELP